MEFKVILGVALFLVIGLLFYPAITSTISNNQIYGNVNEYLSMTNNTPKSVSYAPIYSFTSLFILNKTTVYNTTAGNLGFSLSRSLPSASPVPFGDPVNLTVNCAYDSNEAIGVYVNSHYFGDINTTNTCPHTFSNISASLLSNPTIIQFGNTGQDINQTMVNSTAINGATGAHKITLAHTRKANETFDVNVASVILANEKVQLSINGNVLGNLSGGAESWTGIGSAYLAQSNNITFTNPSGIEIYNQTDASIPIGMPQVYDMDLMLTPTCLNTTPAVIVINATLEPDENITIYFNGHPMGVMNTNSKTLNPDAGWECQYVSGYKDRFGFSGDGGNTSNISNIRISYERYKNASSIVSSSIDYVYHDYLSNFTNASLLYDRWSAYPVANYSVDLAGTITANDTGTYEAFYVYGTSANQVNNLLMAMIPILFIVFLIYMGIQELRKR